MPKKSVEAWPDLYKDEAKRWPDRLHGDEKEVGNFLGLDESARAPAGTFGARIQLAYLTGLIGRPILTDLRKLKQLRNLMAHRVKISLLHERAQAEIQHLRAKVSSFATVVEAFSPRLRPALERAVAKSSTTERSAAELVWFAAVAIENALLNLRTTNRRIERIETAELNVPPGSS